MDPVRWPLPLRITLVAGLMLLLGGAGILGYRWYVRPTTLTVAAGSLDGEVTKLVSAIAGRLSESGAPVRLKVVQTAGPRESADLFASGKVDLAVVRGDVGDLSEARAVAVLAHAVALLVAPPGTAASDVTELKRSAIGVIGGDANRKLIKVLTDEYDLTRAGVTFKALAPADARRALDAKDVRAVLLVSPLTEKYLSLLRDLFPHNARTGPVLIAVESAGAIAEKERAYESFDVPKGALRGSPAIPAEDLTTLRTSFYLVAQTKLGADLIGDLTQSVMNARRDLLTELPMLAQIAAPDTAADAFVPAHPGAAAFYDGTRESFLDKWGNVIFLAPMIAGGLASVLAAAFKFIRPVKPRTREEALDALYALGPRIRESRHASDLDEIEREIDRLLRNQRSRAIAGNRDEHDVTAVNVAAHRLENLIHDRRILLATQRARTFGS
ncbi:C4-dicarboxylate ABC transporter substrate-binding protein [Bradyrhizobium macuxiense]|uniref:C4-dicarboxylate ABC transporter substrate-binding protein n=1 Tax=Bradyrhizobium macuxiense TaxID=1755647 RepID=A0A109K436_9BRAD|nr:TAXI family TRAP transporter solute-binding subunit [Bradyrhizobium macuxiense]KWV60429.1 C4-dicarboxylate ABC transporter substrate-binding protein [Bradyrhizobium macuxiense]